MLLNSIHSISRRKAIRDFFFNKNERRMIEFSDLATIGLVVYGLTYQGVRHLRISRQMQLKREYLVKLTLDEMTFSDDLDHVVVFVFDRRGCLIRKFPEREVTIQSSRATLQCNVQEGSMNFCVLFSPKLLNITGIHNREDINNQFSDMKGLWIAESGVQQISHNVTLELTLSVNKQPGLDEHLHVASSSLSMLLPPQLVTDAMAKELSIDLKHCSENWNTGSVHYKEGEPDNWLSIRREGDKLILQLRTNFHVTGREAQAELHTEEQTYLLSVHQQVMGVCPKLTVSRHLHVTSGAKNEAIPITVTPDTEETRWRIKCVNANDGGCWYTVYPPVGTFQHGTHTLNVHMESKPANIRSRSLVLTLEAGTYPFSQATEITLMQGICFDYYIEYPQNDPCARHSSVIETPLDDGTDEPLKRYTICVDSNQVWRIVQNEMVDWVAVSEPELLQGLYGGRFTISVTSNANYQVKNGFPAARHTILSLVNDTGVVKDILIYQPGYVRIRGKYWLDRNLAFNGKLAQVAIPLGLDTGGRLNCGGYFQFGRKDNDWSENLVSCKEDWYKGTEESPMCRPECDPSPKGWRIPSRIEMEAFINRPAAPLELQREEDRTNICILSDDGVPVYLPLCGHLSHINGCRISIPHGHRYWTGTSQSPVYGYSLCVEQSRRMYIMHDVKKYGFPIRCIMDGE